MMVSDTCVVSSLANADACRLLFYTALNMNNGSGNKLHFGHNVGAL